MVDRDPKYGIQRRVAGFHDARLDGVGDILALDRVRGASVLDLGCNRGLVSLDMVRAGAALVHGCDYSPKAIDTCREVFADVRYAEYRFEVVDLTKGILEIEAAFGSRDYDVIMILATLHKLSKQFKGGPHLVRQLGEKCRKFFIWRGTEAQHDVNETEVNLLDEALGLAGMIKVHYSKLSELGPAAIWIRRT